MSIRNVAREAYEASQSDRVTAARDAMVALLGDPDAEFSTMTLAEVQSPPQVPYTLVIFADDDSDVHLGVRQEAGAAEWSVYLVADRDGWTILGAPVESLEHLWLLIAEYLPEPAVEPWAPQTVYAVGDQAEYEGVVYECISAHTSQSGWQPPNVPALWVRA